MKHKEFIDFFLDIKKTQLAELTVKSYADILKKYLVADEEVTDMDLFKAQQIMLSMSNLSKATQHRRLVILHEYYKYAIKYKKAAYNAFDEVEKVKTVKKDVRNYAYTQEELKNLFAALDELPLQWKTMFTLSLDSGARRGELVALKWENVNLPERTVIIKNNAYCLNGKTKLKEPKGKKERMIKISEETARLLKILLLEQKKNALRKSVPLEFVFPSKKGKPLNPASVSHKWLKFIKSHNLNKHRLHDLRHTTATILLDSGIDVNTVKLRLGHASLTTTMLYLHNNNDVMAATIMSKLLTGVEPVTSALPMRCSTY